MPPKRTLDPPVFPEKLDAVTARLLFSLFSLPLVLLAGEPAAGPAPVEPRTLPAPDQPVAGHKPVIERLDDGTMRIGKIAFDPKTREIRFPTEVNQTNGLLEFLVVHHKGKVHESLLHTDISATNLNIAFKLLNYQSSRELYMKLEDDGSLSSVFEEATTEEKQGSRIKIGVEWNEDGKKKTAAINDWISHAATEAPMSADPWVYGGSFVVEGKFVAETSGDIIAIFLSNAAVINFSGKDNQNDDVWLPHANRVPEIGTPVTLVLSPFEPNK